MWLRYHKTKVCKKKSGPYKTTQSAAAPSSTSADVTGVVLIYCGTAVATTTSSPALFYCGARVPTAAAGYLLRRRGRHLLPQCRSIRALGYTRNLSCVPQHSSIAATGYLLQQPQLPAAVAGPVRILPQYECFYTNPKKS